MLKYLQWAHQYLSIGIVLLVVWCVWCAGPEKACAQTSETPAPQPESSDTSQADQPFTLGGDHLKWRTEEGGQRTLTITQNAQFIREDISVFCESLVIYFTPAQELEKAVAIGDVRIITQDVTSTGEQGTFYVNDQKLELEGQARAVQGKSTITAHRLVAFLETMMIEGYGDSSSERVVMTVYSRQESSSENSSEQPDQAADSDLSPIVVESDELKYDNAVRKAIFTGKVMARQDPMTINADTMNVYLTETGETETSDIEKIEVSGNVRIVQDNITIKGAKGVYRNTENVAVIEGDEDQQAQAEDGTQTLTADRITLLLDTNDMEAEGNAVVKMLPAGARGQNK